MTDIAADKVQTIGRRGTWRDYVDIFYLLKREVFNLRDLIELAIKKFNGEFAAHLFLQQLTYFLDIKDFKADLIEDKYTKEGIQNYLLEMVKEYKKEYIKG